KSRARERTRPSPTRAPATILGRQLRRADGAASQGLRVLAVNRTHRPSRGTAMLPVSVLLRGRPPPHVLHPDASVAEAARYFCAHSFGGAPVLKDEKLVGFFSERDIVHRVIAEGRDPDATRVADVMSRKVTTATIECTIGECEKKMRRAHVRHLPILD